MTAPVAVAGRPLAVRVLRATGWLALACSVLATGIGALLGFDELAKIWIAVAVILFLVAGTALLGARPTRGGLASALVACTLLLLLLPVGTVITVALALIASQTWPELRRYYRLERGPA